MSDTYANRRFRHITTRAVLPDGRVRLSSNSYPLGVGKDVYDRIDAALLRAYGNENSRTTGYFFENPASAIKSDRTRRDGDVPSPCIACGKQLDSAANDPSFDQVPYEGTLFTTRGHYGSTVFDSFTGCKLKIVVCDACLTAHAADRVRFVDPKGATTPWDGVTGETDDEPQDDHPAG